MALYVLSYDLREDRNYQPLYDKLREFNAVRVLESCWCFNRIKTNTKGLREYFLQFVDNNDGLWVSQIAEIDGVPQWAGWNLDGNPNQL